ncbi:alpha/beta fold hydrolase [Polyangium sorediatum]|uniref:Alpha/beta fold hydrolase n=1 Tax=Polyangium sorediatum TaxID=889274 RepID=A0ABT6NTX2_9BACT|nr:alpha/beta fold hydrolase [Polyangium sorediatum]MDI1431743.1 alpha/beta fold hydrolase [Polyangium sorediatum]
MTDIHAVVSRPGPVEAAILASLGDSFEVKRRALPPVTLRTLEGGQGAPVLFLHGRGDAGTIWAPALVEVARSHRVIAVDLPGFGHSSSLPFRGEDRDAAVRFFVEPIAALVRELGLAEASLVGHSLGGLVALELALGGHVRPPKLALVASMGLGPFASLRSRAFFRLGPERIARTLGALALPRAAQGDAWSERLTRLEVELFSVLGGKAPPVRAFDALLPIVGPAYERSSELQRIDADTLLVWGERDPFLPAPIAIGAAAAMPHAQLVMLPGLGHTPHITDAARVTDLLSSFLA